MSLKRRAFIQLSAAAAGSGIIASVSACSPPKEKDDKETIPATLTSMTTDVAPISLQEREVRIEKAQRLMAEQGIAALVLDSGTSLKYFTGLSWGASERPMVAIIPAKGEVCYVGPAFEEGRLRELINIGDKVYTWQEDESPYKQIAIAFKDHGVITGNIGLEERVRFFVFDGIRKESSHFNYVSGDVVTIPCRLIKSAAEIALMQRANDITMKAIQLGIDSLKEGMTAGEVSSIISGAQQKMGAETGFADANFAAATASPHGSSKPQHLKKGDVVLMDCGCRVEGYFSDITRTIVFGAEPTARQQNIWDLEKQSQAAGFAAAMIGKTCESVDAAARKVITDAGFGPDYKLPGLPHRTGHGIGMDVHEWGNIVKGNQLVLQPGMCFSIEPTIAIPGEFGVRHEDCVYMTEEGPKWFSQPAVSISQPFV